MATAKAGEAFREMLRTLHEARRTLEAELDADLHAHPLNQVALRYLHDATGQLSNQSLLLAVLILQEPEAETALVREAETLSMFFKLVGDQIASLLGPD